MRLICSARASESWAAVVVVVVVVVAVVATPASGRLQLGSWQSTLMAVTSNCLDASVVIAMNNASNCLAASVVKPLNKARNYPDCFSGNTNEQG